MAEAPNTNEDILEAEDDQMIQHEEDTSDHMNHDDDDEDVDDNNGVVVNDTVPGDEGKSGNHESSFQDDGTDNDPLVSDAVIIGIRDGDDGDNEEEDDEDIANVSSLLKVDKVKWTQEEVSL